MGPFEDALFSWRLASSEVRWKRILGYASSDDKVLTAGLRAPTNSLSPPERLRTEAAEDAFGEAKAKLEVLAYEAPDLTRAAGAGADLERPEPFSRDGGEAFATAGFESGLFRRGKEEGYNSEVPSLETSGGHPGH